MENNAFMDDQLTKGGIPAAGVGLSENHDVPLTSSEISNLWHCCMNYSMVRCIKQHFLANVEDADIRRVLEKGLGIVEQRVETAGGILDREGQPVPTGFDEDDVDPTAPRLYSDQFYLYYVYNMVRFGINLNSILLATSPRPDVRRFFSRCVVLGVEFLSEITDTLLDKGLYVRSPLITTTKEIDYVKKKSFLAGYFEKPRPLLAVEVKQLYLNTVTNNLGQNLLMGFRQVAREEPVRRYMDRGVKIADKHIDIFNAVLRENEINVPASWGISVSDSTISPFSDKLMMQHTLVLNALGIGEYTVSMTLSPRNDLAATYARLSAEVFDYSNDGVKLMIDNGWFEEPPRVVDRRELVSQLRH